MKIAFVLAVCLCGYVSLSDAASVAILGLGAMGKSIVSCLSSKGHQVHGWNRSETKRKEVENMQLDGVVVHSDIKEALLSSDVIIMILSGEMKDLKTVNDVLKTAGKQAWKGKTLIQFSTHEPLAAKEHKKIAKSYGVKSLVAGAMIATPKEVCTDMSLFLISADEDDTDGIDDVSPLIKDISPIFSFPGDVGMASLVDIVLIQSFFFGMAGYELSLLLLRNYGLANEVVTSITDFCKQMIPALLPSFLDLYQQAVMTKDYANQAKVTSAAVSTGTYEVHLDFLRKMGIRTETYLSAYFKKILKVDPSLGTSQIVEYYGATEPEL